MAYATDPYGTRYAGSADAWKVPKPAAMAGGRGAAGNQQAMGAGLTHTAGGPGATLPGIANPNTSSTDLPEQPEYPGWIPPQFQNNNPLGPGSLDTAPPSGASTGGSAPVQTGPGSSFDQSLAVIPGGGPNAYRTWGQNGAPDWTPGPANYGAPDNAPTGFGGTPLTQAQRNAAVSKPADFTIATNDPDVWLSPGGAVWQTPGKTWGAAGMNNAAVFGTNPADGDSSYHLPSGRYHANRTTGVLEPW